MRYFIPIATLLLSMGCHQQPTPAIQYVPLVADSINTAEKHIVFVTRVSTELPGCLLSFKTSYQLPNHPIQEDSSSYIDRHWLFVENRTTHDKDSFALTDITDNSPGAIEIKDVSEELHLAPLLVELTCNLESDAFYAVYFSYTNDSLNLLFSTDGPVISMQREVNNTLRGTLITRVDNLPFSAKYKFSVLNGDHQLHIIRPDTEALNYPGEARMAITAFRLDGNKHIPYIIKEATRFRLDTLYRPANLLRVTVSDSIPVYGPPDEILSALVDNDAG